MTLRQPFSVLAAVRPGFICKQCQKKGARQLHLRYLARLERAKHEWEEQAVEIRAGRKQSTLDFFEERGFLHSTAGDRKVVDRVLTNKRIGCYAGVDPTAASLHIGHMLTLMPVFWMYLRGYQALTLIGGATARIGDPTGRTSARPQLSSAARKANLASIHYQLKRLWLNVEEIERAHVKEYGEKYGCKIEEHRIRGIGNNQTWWNKAPMLDILKLVGDGMRMGTLLSRDNVKTRLESGDGMSFSEFCYPILQGWDFWELYRQRTIQFQIGGSDQFGNIVSGIDVVKHILKNHPDQQYRVSDDEGITELKAPYGMTVPLLTNAAGDKIGKSAGNAIWMDDTMTTSYDLYAHFVRISDAEVEKYLKLFTFLPTRVIQSIMSKHNLNPPERIAQHKLAFEFVRLAHGIVKAKETQAKHQARFRDQSSLAGLLSASEPAVATSPDGTMPPRTPQLPQPAPDNPFLSNQNAYKRMQGTFVTPSINKHATADNANSQGVQSVVLPKSLIYNTPVARVLYAAGMVTSRSEGHRLCSSKGAYLGNKAGALVKGKEHETMQDQLSFVPAKVSDPSQTWRHVIRDEKPEPGVEGLLILRIGKWRVRICTIMSDEAFEALNLPPPPGWIEYKAERAAERNEELYAEATAHDHRRRSAEEATKAQQREAMAYLAKKGVSQKDQKNAIWQTWGPKTKETDQNNDQEGDGQEVMDLEEKMQQEQANARAAENTTPRQPRERRSYGRKVAEKPNWQQKLEARRAKQKAATPPMQGKRRLEALQARRQAEETGSMPLFSEQDAKPRQGTSVW